MKHTLLAAVAALAITGFGAVATAETVVDDKALNALDQGGNWLGYGRTSAEQRYSPLDQITAANVAKLGVAWSLDLPTDRSLIATPLVVDGVMYFNGSFNVVHAVDVRTHQKLWTYDPKSIEHAGDRATIMWD